ncbi:glycosyltransferase [Zhongshania sp.]|uniref:glycosyltransferase n=1 Tax=Zhongshania sp. TaxID=1971902 RepID=UPI00356B0467
MTTGNSILFTTHVGNPGGAEIKMLELIKATPHSRVVLLEEGTLENTIQNYGVNVTVAKDSKSLNQYRRESSIFSAIRSIPTVIKLLSFARKETKDVKIIVCMSQKSFLIFSLATLLRNKKLIWFMNDIVSSSHFSLFSRLVIKTFARLFSDVVVLNSQASLHQWKKSGMYCKREVVIYSGVNDALINTSPESINDEHSVSQLIKWKTDFSLIGMFGRISHWKGQQVLINALKDLPKHKVIFVGGAQFEDDSYKSSLLKLAEELKVNDRIIFLGHKENIFDYMKLCEVVVHCSTSPEPFGRVIVEAMLCGKIVVASDSGGPTEIIVDGETGYLYPAGNAKELAEILSHLPILKEREVMENAARSRAIKFFTAKKMCVDFRNLCQQL